MPQRAVEAWTSEEGAGVGSWDGDSDVHVDVHVDMDVCVSIDVNEIALQHAGSPRTTTMATFAVGHAWSLKKNKLPSTLGLSFELFWEYITTL